MNLQEQQLQKDINDVMAAEREEKKLDTYSLDSSVTPWDGSLATMALIFCLALFIVGGIAERTMNSAAKKQMQNAPQPEVVIGDRAPVPQAVPAYPEVYVNQSKDPSMTPSPLPPGPVQPEIQLESQVRPKARPN